MCVNCGNTDDCSCSKSAEIKTTSQIIYDGEDINLPNSGIVIEKCDSLNDIILKLANAIETNSTP